MKNDKEFIIVKNMKEFILSLDKYIVNYPKKEYEIRNLLVNDCYEILRLVYEINYDKVDNRRDKQLYLLSKINIIDFYFEISFKKKIISEKQFNKLGIQLQKIAGLVYKWIESNGSKK